MPSSTSGWSGDEIISYVQGYIGNSDSEFQSYLATSLALAEFRYCKEHDWDFLNKQNLSLTVVSGTDEYTLSVANLGFYMKSSDIKRIYSVAHNRYLKKVTLDEIRLLDPDKNDGSTAAEIEFWAPIGDNKIVVWPPQFSDTTLKVDGKVTPTALTTTSNYPTIPIHYQDSFIAFVLAMALERENDDRAAQKMTQAMMLIEKDKQADQATLSNSGQPRFRSMFEDPGALAGKLEFDPLNMAGR